MKDIIDIENALKRSKSTLRSKFKVKRIGVFGSYARGEQRPRSDIDILVELEEPLGWDFLDLKEYLEKILGGAVDLVTIDALKPQLSERILKEVVFA